MRNTRILILVEVALAVALSAALNVLAVRLPISVAGGSISLTMLPIAIVALRRGPVAGLAAGALFGFIDLLMEPFIIFPAQVILDYPAPYLLFGLCVGLFAPLYHRLTANDLQLTAGAYLVRGSALIIVALIGGGILRFASHVLSGVLFFAEYAEGQNVWVYSLVYNISYLAPSLVATLICTLVILPVLEKAVPVQHLQAQAARL